MAERIEFAEAITEKLLLAKRFSELSLPQAVALKSFYGLPLKDRELDIWALFQERAIYDPLGYPLETTPLLYIPKEYSYLNTVLGRRSGKTDSISSFIVTYEALLGGHEEYIRKGAQEAVCFLLAQDLKNARQALNLIKANIDSSPLLAKEYAKDPTAEDIFLKNGVRIHVSPSNAKHVRGSAAPVVVMDEVGMWYTDAESANPDFEIERAVKFAQIQFPHHKRVITSTPWTKEGLLYKYYEAGTEGWKIKDPAQRDEYKGLLCLHAPTPAMENPLLKKEFFQRELAKDSEAYQREVLARFVDSISSFLNASLLRGAVDKGIIQRKAESGPYYIAAIDPAFRRDSFAFTIVHADPAKGIVQDCVKKWTSQNGVPLNPTLILEELAPILKEYKVGILYSDQYQLESLQQLALKMSLTIEGVDFTSKSKAKIYGSLQQLINQKRLVLLDDPRQVDELVSLERKLTALGGVQVAAPAGRHDDMASVLALAAFKAVWLLPDQKKDQPAADPTIFEKGMAVLKKAKLNRRAAWE